MNRSKKIVMTGALALGIGAGAFMFTPQGMSASSNVVLASVDWVTSQLNPMKSKITELETRIAAQQQDINYLRSQLGNTSNPPTTPGQGQLPSYVYVEKSSVKIHSGALTSYKVVAYKSTGATLKVIDSFTNSAGLWYRVEVSASLKGWILAENVTTTKPSTTAPTSVYTIGDVHIRKGATQGYSIIQTVPAGTTLKYLSTFVNSSGEKWYNVQTSSGSKGWMYGGLGEVR